VFDSVSVFVKNRSIIKLKNKYGVVDFSGAYVIKPNYYSIELRQYVFMTKVFKKSKTRCYSLNGIPALCSFSVGCGHFNSDRAFWPYVGSIFEENNRYAISYLKNIECEGESLRNEEDKKAYLDTTSFVYDKIIKYGISSYILKKDSLIGIMNSNQFYGDIECLYDTLVEQRQYGLLALTSINKYRQNNFVGSG